MGFSSRMSPTDFRKPTVTNPTPDQIWDKLNEVERMSRATLDAIQGVPAFGQVGIVGEIRDLKIRQNAVEAALEKHDRKLFRFGTIFAVIGAFCLFAKDIVVQIVAGWFSNRSG